MFVRCNGRHCDQHTTRRSLDREFILKLDRRRNICEKREIVTVLENDLRENRSGAVLRLTVFQERKSARNCLKRKKNVLLVLNS